MKIKDIFYIVCRLCGNETLADAVKNGEAGADADVKKMFDCYNLLLSELSEEVLPLTFSEVLTSENGKFYYSCFSKAPKEILRVFADGKAVKFEVYPEYVKVDCSKAEFLYDYIPQKGEKLDDQAEYDGIFSARVIALGVAGEYLLLCGLYDEALTMRNKFENALTSFKLKKKRITPARRWA